MAKITKAPMTSFGYFCSSFLLYFTMQRYFKALSTQSIWVQLLFFGILTVGSLILFAVIGQLLCILLYGYPTYNAALSIIANPSLLSDPNMMVPDNLMAILVISQISSQIGLFIIPPVLMIFLLWNRHTPGYRTLISPPGMFRSLLVFPLFSRRCR